MTERIVDLENNLAYAVNNQAEQLDHMRGLGLTGDLAAAEAASWRRFLPGGKLPWTELEAYEREVGKLEERRAENERKRLGLTEQLQAAPQGDREVLSQWQRDGQPGARPEPSAPKLEAELKQLQEDERAYLEAIDSVTNERVGFVVKNRSKLVKDAAAVEAKARERAQRAVDELEAAREGLVEARRVRLWCELYPAQETMREPIWPFLAGGLKRVLQSLGINTQPPAAETVFAALREDVEWVASAVSRQQQANSVIHAGRSRTATAGSRTSRHIGGRRSPMRPPPWLTDSRAGKRISVAWGGRSRWFSRTQGLGRCCPEAATAGAGRAAHRPPRLAAVPVGTRPLRVEASMLA